MKLITIDWDYFFPCPIWYDLSHFENGFMIHDIWYHRCNNFNIETGVSILDEYVPDMKLIDLFFENLRFDPCRLVISESHMHIVENFNFFEVDAIYNFDAHHDLFTSSEETGQINCGNWADYLLSQFEIDNYVIVHPEREKIKPSNPPLKPHTHNYSTNINVMYGIPDDLPVFDFIHICRSGAWTPPWADHLFIEFVNRFNTFDVWQQKIVIDDPLAQRKPDHIEAIEVKSQFDKIRNDLIDKNQNRLYNKGE